MICLLLFHGCGCLSDCVRQTRERGLTAPAVQPPTVSFTVKKFVMEEAHFEFTMPPAPEPQSPMYELVKWLIGANVLKSLMDKPVVFSTADDIKKVSPF